jgi:hypothetical protein
MRKLFPVIACTAMFLTGCSSEQQTAALNSGRTNISQVQQEFRESILSKYVEVVGEDLTIAEAVNPDNTNYRKVSESAELKAWRAEIAESWKELKDNQRDLMCELYFQGILDDSSGFAQYFVTVKKQLGKEGTTIHSINNIRMREDNRKTIQLPTKEYSSSLFVCSARIVLKMSNGDFSQPIDSSISLNYYLDGREIKSTFTFKLKS